MAKKDNLFPVPDKNVVATFEMAVEYEQLPDGSVLQDIIENARCDGYVKTAKFRIHKMVEQDLV